MAFKPDQCTARKQASQHLKCTNAWSSMRVCPAYQVSKRALMCKGAIVLYVKCSVCYIQYFYYKLNIEPAFSNTCLTCKCQNTYFNHINCHYCSLKWQAFEDIKLNKSWQQSKSVMKAYVFHMYKNLIKSLHLVQYRRQKRISAGNVEEDPNGYGCST